MKKLLLSLIVALGFATVSQAATRIEIPGGIYAEACPNGRYAALVMNSHIATDSGNIALPGENVLDLRSSCETTQRLCGTGHQTGTAWLYNGAQWENLGIAFGNNACIFAGSEVKFVRGPGEPSGSQGFRYVDFNGRVFYAFETYADPVRQIFEYTDRGALTIGQGPETGCHLVTANSRRLVESGDCRFVRYNGLSDQQAVGISKLGEGKAVLQWLTVNELLNLPLVDDNPPPPVEKCDDGIDNDGDGLIDEGCPPPAQTTPDDHAVVEATNTANPKLLIRNTHEDACQFTLLAAQNLNKKDANWGLLSKPPGQNGCDASFGRYAVDAVIYLKTQQVIDIISGAGDEVPARTTWGPQPKRPDNHWMQPPDGDEPPPSDLEERVALLENEVKELNAITIVQQSSINKLETAVADLNAKVAALEQSGNLTEERVRELILDYISRLAISGQTASSIAHRHGVGSLVIIIK